MSDAGCQKTTDSRMSLDCVHSDGTRAGQLRIMSETKPLLVEGPNTSLVESIGGLY